MFSTGAGRRGGGAGSKAVADDHLLLGEREARAVDIDASAYADAAC